jgi:Domain of unknown function (DUF4350)
VTRRRVILVAAAVVGLGALVGLSPRSEDPDSTLALRRYLANLGLTVAEGAGLPERGETLVLLSDLRTRDEAQRLLDWAEIGGHLVVADPASEIVGMVGGSTGAPLGWTGLSELEPRCLTAAVVGVERIVVRAADRVLVANDPDMITCFAVEDGGLLLTRTFGDGTVTLLGGTSAFSNALLPEADNAVLAAGVAGPGPHVLFGPPGTAAAAPSGVWDALPDGGRAALLAIIAAAVAFGLVRARRLGGPVVEEPIAPIPGSELVRAAGRMYRRARTPGYAGSLMRRAAISRLSKRLGVDARELSVALARVSELPRERIGEILEGPAPRDDDELMALGAELETVSTRAEMRSR